MPSYTLKHGTLECPVTVERIDRVVDTEALDRDDKERIERNAVGEVVLRTRRLLAVDEHHVSPATGRFVLVHDYVPVAGGQISMEGYPDQRNLVTVRSTNITAVGHGVTPTRAPQRNGHRARCSGSPASPVPASRRSRSRRGRALHPRLSRLRPRRRQHPHRAQRQSELLARGPGREHPARRRGRRAVRGRRLHRHQLVHLALPQRPAAGAGGRGRALPRDLRQGPPRGLRGARPQGPLQARPHRRDQGLHRHLNPPTRPPTTPSSWSIRANSTSRTASPSCFATSR